MTDAASQPDHDSKYATKPYETEGMPPGIPYIIGNEAAERFSFYGMKTILFVFMTKYLLDTTGEPAYMDEVQARAWFHYFVTAVYFLPIFGAIIADWLFGKYPTIMILSLVYCAGHGVLALMDSPIASAVEPRTLMIWGLVLIAIGSGGIKPCVSSHVGDQFGYKNRHLVSKVYSWFYFSINFGSTFSTLLTPVLLQYFGPGWAFGVPGILMAIATFMFWMGRNKYVHIPPSGDRFFEETFSKEGVSAMLNLIPLYLLIVMFWALFDQTGSAWVEQADSMNRLLNMGVKIPYVTDDNGIMEVLPSQLQAINPILVMLLIPIFSYGFYPAVNRVFPFTPLRKIGAGLFVTVLAFLITGLVQVKIEDGAQPHIYWHLLAYIVLTAAEVMVSITALEFSYTQAPKRMKSFIQGLYLMSVAGGNYFTAFINEVILHQKEQGNKLLDGANYYWFFAGCMLATAVIFLIWSPFYKGKYILQDAETEIDPALETPAAT